MTAIENSAPWFGQMPTDWHRSRIRNVAVLSPDYSSSVPYEDELCTIVPMELLSTDGMVDFSNQQPFLDIASGLTLFEPGDVLFAKITPCMENGKGAFVRALPTRYAFGSTEFHVLRPSSKVDGKFLYYATFNPIFREYAAENMTGAAGQKRVSSRFIKDTRLPLPPLSEQQLIVEYLDASCAAIDAAVAAKRRQLETLDAIQRSIISRAVTYGIADRPKLQRIDHDWITEAPMHWEVCRVKRVLSRMDYGISVSTIEEGRFPVLKMGHLQNGEITYANLDFVDEVDEDLILQTGDLLYNRTNSPDQVGKAAIFRKSKVDEVTFASYLVRMRTNHRANPLYLNYVLNSDGFLGFARRLAIPSVQQSNLNSTRYSGIFIPLPPAREQGAITDYLDEKIGEAKRVYDQLEAQISTLNSYRNSLIHECVTGQRRITEADLNQVKVYA